MEYSLEIKFRSMIDITAVVLTFNEEIHIERCLNNLIPFCKYIIIIDSYSNDRTIEIANKFDVIIYQNTWINYARQFEWAMQNCPIETEWIMRVDADEYFTPGLINELQDIDKHISVDVNGLIMRRRTIFLGKWIRFGGTYPTYLLRIWRKGKARIEQRWMDEHVELLSGKTVVLKFDFIDENLKGIHSWIIKHNNYANRELIDILAQKEKIIKLNSIIENVFQDQASRRKWLKQKIYNNFPPVIRPILYFLYRYFILLGFLDGKEGFAWHFLQGLWYRSLIDLKYTEMKKSCGDDKTKIIKYIKDKYDLKVD